MAEKIPQGLAAHPILTYTEKRLSARTSPAEPVLPLKHVLMNLECKAGRARDAPHIYCYTAWTLKWVHQACDRKGLWRPCKYVTSPPQLARLGLPLPHPCHCPAREALSSSIPASSCTVPPDNPLQAGARRKIVQVLSVQCCQVYGLHVESRSIQSYKVWCAV